MEEVKAYIESGILELYVLGQLTHSEQEEVEAMAARHPEIQTEIGAIELAMEEYALQNAIAPSASLDQKILASLSSLQGNEEALKTGQKAPAPEARVASLPPQQTTDSRIRSLRIALTACAALLLICLVALFSAHSKLNEAENQIASLSSRNQKFAATVDFMKSHNEDLQKIANMATDPAWKMIRLSGTKMDPQAKMTVYWHAAGKHVMVDNSKMDLPVNDQAHQYQLWALVNGKPVDLGVFDVKSDTSHILVNMKEIGVAQAFAVTLEKRGGSPSPTMEKMIAMGGVSI